MIALLNFLTKGSKALKCFNQALALYVKDVINSWEYFGIIFICKNAQKLAKRLHKYIKAV
jgi:hypothetical protein